MSKRPIIVVLIVCGLLILTCFALAEMAPLTGQIIMDKIVINGGETVTATWKVTGGKEPYTVKNWGWNAYLGGTSQNDESVYGSNTQTSYSFTPLKGDRCNFYIEVADANGNSKYLESSYVAIEQNSAITPLSGQLILDKTQM